ncbi:hypothetical protein B586_06265 [Mycobacterium haemophilum DSM 44634]|uniref:hypothetical protein n=1 Tax=Mycobacterium haemophilum TaxID=29311 RepID=UPI000655AC5F|nr:hypothetical protein [Mycobacterium haemophilum]AKN16256.1 hypothetical protein B586_06265 [Mycobacterium haemophilum DSM 44634]MCV7339762.1 hypothetical protein [Mycobacterium haemophilum DSM 44634]
MTEPDDPPSPTPPHVPTASPDGSRTRIIRRAPTGPIPAVAESAAPTRVGRRADLTGAPTDEPSSRAAVAACAVSIVSGWATSVVATDLIAGWWKSDRLFCLAVGFLALVFAISTVSGVIMLLQRRSIGRYLIVAGAVVALLTYGGVFIAGARVAWIVHALPVLPIASAVLVALPQTKRWLES